MALQIPSTGSSGSGGAVDQVDPTARFGQGIEQRVEAPNAPTGIGGVAANTAGYMAESANALARVATDATEKFKGLRAAEEHSKLINDQIEIQQEQSDARKAAAQYAAENGLDVDGQAEHYTSLKADIYAKRSPDRFSDPTVRETATARFKEMEFNDKLNYEQSVVNPGRVGAIKIANEAAVQNVNRHIENNPDTTAEQVDEYKKSVGEMLSTPYAIVTLGPEGAMAAKLKAFSQIDQRLADNKIEGATKGVEQAATIEEATALAEKQKADAIAAIRSRPNLSADQIDKLTDKLQRNVEVSLGAAQRNITNAQNKEVAVMVYSMEKTTFDTQRGIRNGTMSFGKADLVVQSFIEKSSEAAQAGNMKLAEAYQNKAQHIMKSMDDATTRNAAKAERTLAKLVPTLESKAIIGSGQTITDQKHADAYYTDATSKLSITQNTERVAVMLPVIKQMAVIPDGLKADVLQLVKSKDPLLVQAGYTQLNQIVTANPALKAHFDEPTRAGLEMIQAGTPANAINDTLDKLAKTPHDLQQVRVKEFNKFNVTSDGPDKYKNTFITTQLKKSLDTKSIAISDDLREAVTARSRDLYKIYGNKDMSVKMAIDELTKPNLDPHQQVWGVTKFAPQQVTLPNPPELKEHDIAGFGKQLETKLKDFPKEDGKPLKQGEYLVKWKGVSNEGSNVYTVLVPDPMAGNAMTKPIIDFQYDKKLAEKQAADQLKRNTDKALSERAALLEAKKNETQKKLLVPSKYSSIVKTTEGQ